MNKLTICAAALLLTATLSTNAQQTKSTSQSSNSQQKTTTQSSNAVYAYANGDDSYLLYSSHTYKADKSYIVIKFWNEKDPINEQEQNEFAYVKKHLAKLNVEVVEFKWKNEQDLKDVLNKYNLSVKVENDKRINIKNDNINLNTTAGKAIFVLENNKAISLCSGQNCESRLKAFFQIKSPA